MRQIVRPCGGVLVHGLADFLDRRDQVRAFAFHNLQRHGGFTVIARCTLAVFERQADVRQLPERNNAVAIAFNRQAVNILWIIERRRNLDRISAGTDRNLARGNQAVVVVHNVQQFTCGDVIRLHLQRIDQDFQHLVTLSRDVRLQHTGNTFDLGLQILGDTQHRAFGDVTGKRNHQHREFREIHFVNRILPNVIWQRRDRRRHFITHIGQRGFTIPVQFELQRDTGITLGSRRRQTFQACYIGQNRFQRTNQQFLGIFSGNTGVGNGDKQERHRYIRLPFLG